LKSGQRKLQRGQPRKRLATLNKLYNYPKKKGKRKAFSSSSSDNKRIKRGGGDVGLVEVAPAVTAAPTQTTRHGRTIWRPKKIE
jgi:hypothetical protein